MTKRTQHKTSELIAKIPWIREGLQARETARGLLRKQVDEFKRGRMDFEKTAEICMFSRQITTEHLGLWLARGERGLRDPEVATEIEVELDAGVRAVGRFYHSPSPEAQRERLRVKSYLINDGRRLTRMKHLHVGPEVFQLELESQFQGVVRARAIPVCGTPLAPLGEMPDASEEHRLVLDWFERFYLETSQFLFEIEVEASPYLSSARQEAETGKRLVARLQAALPTLGPAASLEAQQLVETGQRLISGFERAVVTPLAKAAASSEAEAQRIFEDLRVLIERSRIEAREGLEAARRLVEMPGEWSEVREARFCELVRREAAATINPAESQELETLANARRARQHPVPEQERQRRHDQWEITERLLRLLEEYGQRHG